MLFLSRLVAPFSRNETALSLETRYNKPGHVSRNPEENSRRTVVFPSKQLSSSPSRRSLFHRILSLIPFLQLFTDHLFVSTNGGSRLSIYQGLIGETRILCNPRVDKLGHVGKRGNNIPHGDRSKSLSAYRSSSVIQCRADTNRERVAGIYPPFN